MEFDFIFVLGVVIAALGVPSFAASYAERNRPMQALLLFLIGGGMMYYAIVMNPGGYSLTTVDDAILRVVGWVLNE